MLRPSTVRNALLVLSALVFTLPATAHAAAWLSPIHVGGTTGLAPSPAIDANGNALVGWQEGTPGVIHAARHAAGTPGFTVLPNVSPASPFDSSSPVVAVGRAGGIAAWVQTLVMNNKEIDILAVSPTGKPGTLTRISAAGMNPSHITAAINANGDAVVAWEQGAQVVAVTREGLNGTFTKTPTPDTIDTLGDSPAAAIDAAGDAIVVMHHNAFFQEISESHHLAGGTTWSAPATLTPPPGDAFTNPDVAANATGAIVLAFSDSSGGNNIVSEVSGTAAAGWGT